MTRPVVAWTTAALSLFFVVGATIFGLQNGTTLRELVGTFSLATAVGGAHFAVIGALVTARRPKNRLGPIFLVIGITQTFNAFVGEYGLYALETAPDSVPLGALAARLSWTWAPGFGLFTTAAILLFPDGRLPSPRWRWTVPVTIVALTLLIVPMALAGAVISERQLVAVLLDGAASGRLLGWALNLQAAGIALCLSMMLVSIAGVIARFRRSNGDERQQLKWFIYFALGTLAFLLFMISVAQTITNPIVLGMLTIVPFLGGIPTGVAIAIFKYRLYDIDVVINRTLVYGSLSAILAGAYLGLVFSFQSALAPVTRESDLAVAGSTLAVAALFRPVRARVQDFIDRRFYRRKFDAERTLESFASNLRDKVDLRQLSAALTTVVVDTMQPAHVSLWLRGREFGEAA